MNTEKKQEISKALQEWHDKDNTERSLSALVSKTGVNRSTISHILNGKFEVVHKEEGKKPTVISDEYFFRIARGIGFSVATEVHIATESYQRGYDMCHYAQQTARNILLDGSSGSGKTYLLEKYASENEKVLYVKCTSRMKGRDLIEKICKLLRMTPKSRTDSGKIQEIADKLAQPGYLLIIDEGESVAKDIYRVIKDLTDALYRKAGIVLCGMGLIAELKAGAERNAKLMPQLWRRFRGNRRSLKALTKKTIEEACHAYGITERQVIAYMQGRIEDMGMLNEWLTDILDLLIHQGRPVTPDTVKELFEF